MSPGGRPGSVSGVVFNIQRWSVHDGQGIRTTVFLKGCPLRCAWCANPESWNRRPEHGYGLTMTPAELMAQLRKDEIFYRQSGGGVSFSGGEPLSQPAFLRECLGLCRRRGYATALETSGFAPWDQVEAILPLVDEIFVDIKHMDDGRHRRLTGVSNLPILANIREILNRHSNVTIRAPLVGGLNDQAENISALGRFLKPLTNLKGLEFLKYHNLGVSKYAALSRPSPPAFSPPDHKTVSALKDIIGNLGLPLIEDGGLV